MINHYQPLHLTVKGYAETYMKKIFIEWFGMKISETLKEGKEHEDINIPFTLSLLKPLHVNCMIKLYNEKTSASGKNATFKRWKNRNCRWKVQDYNHKLFLMKLNGYVLCT